MTLLRCRHCGTPLHHQVIDLGHQPPSNAYLTAEQLKRPEITYPLKVYVCTDCWLMQLPAHASAEMLFTPDYAYFSSMSSSWCAHAERYVATTCQRLNLDASSLVVELASNDGYLLQYVQQRAIPCLGIEPTRAAAEVARRRGLTTVERFFGVELAEELIQRHGPAAGGADLVVANNVLAHVPDINDFVAGISRLLKPTGQVSIEVPHLLNLLKGNQFDTIYHEHYSYLSLGVLERIAASQGLRAVDVDTLPTHGGSLRVWLARSDGALMAGGAGLERLQAVRRAEQAAGLESLAAYQGFQQRAEAAKHALLSFLLQARHRGERVLAYGAAAKGNTLLNYAGVRADLLAAVADKAPGKIGRFLPASHIPVLAPEALLALQPDTLLILPWNLTNEVKADLAHHANLSFVRAIPSLERV